MTSSFEIKFVREKREGRDLLQKNNNAIIFIATTHSAGTSVFLYQNSLLRYSRFSRTVY
jgi:hypothetical protein